MNSHLRFFSFFLFCSIFFLQLCWTDNKIKSVTYSPHMMNENCHMNMGPTGATAWMKGNHFVVTTIDVGSPCHGLLELADVVIGANGTMFSNQNDLRMTLGNAIEISEKENSPLTLTVVRKGKQKSISINLPKLGGYSATWPYNCDKSKKILNATCHFMLYSQLPNGRYVSDGNFDTFSAGLLFLASGDPRYFDAARRTAHYVASFDFSKIDYDSWALGYGGVFMAEYYLATGDVTVLENLNKVVKEIAAGQMKCGSWGHKSPGGGYGALNQPGLMCTMALVLAKECGILVDEKILNKALTFFNKYPKLGSVPYGDHFPGRSLDDNGKNSTAALTLNLAGYSESASILSSSVAQSYFMREEGHTGGLFSIAWGPLAAALSSDEEFNKFMDYQKWFYNLSRTWKGSFISLPYQEALTRFDSAGYVQLGPNMCTSVIGLTFALPQKRLRITGAPVSIFSARITGDLAKARTLYQTKKWPEFKKALASINESHLKTKNEKYWLKQLKDLQAFNEKSTFYTLTEIKSNLVEKAAYRASEQFKSLKVYLGGNAHPALPLIEKEIASGSNPWFIKEAEKHYENWAKFKTNSIMTWVPSGSLSRKFMNGLSTLRTPIWEPLSPTSQIDKQEWKSIRIEDFNTLPSNWTNLKYDDSKWYAEKAILSNGNIFKEKSGVASRRVFTIDDPKGYKLRIRLQTVRRALTKVYLNDHLIVDTIRGQRGGYASIELDNSVFKILKKGINVLAIISNTKDPKKNKLDVGLEINRINLDTRTMPRLKTQKIISSHLPEGSSNLYVRREKERFVENLLNNYQKQDPKQLIALLSNDIPYKRTLIQRAFYNKGLEATKVAFKSLNNKDWRVRSSLPPIISNAYYDLVRRKKTPAKFKEYEQFIPVLAKLSQDKHFWVRINALDALATFGKKAAKHAPSILPFVEDNHEWVRAKALKTLFSITNNEPLLTKAVNNGLKRHGTSYGVPWSAMKIIKDEKMNVNAKLESLLHFISNPPEGGGGRMLNEAIDLSFKLDPEGIQLIPVLIKCAADETHCSRQRGNPRNKAIKTLMAYGPKAITAIPTLKSILSSEEKKDVGQHASTQEALNAILGTITPSEK